MGDYDLLLKTARGVTNADKGICRKTNLAVSDPNQVTRSHLLILTNIALCTLYSIGAKFRFGGEQMLSIRYQLTQYNDKQIYK